MLNIYNFFNKVEYLNAHTKVCIICPKYGEFWQLPTNHLSGKWCKLCRESHNLSCLRLLMKYYKK